MDETQASLSPAYGNTLKSPLQWLNSCHNCMGMLATQGEGREGVLVHARHISCHSENVAHDRTLLISTAETNDSKRIHVIGAGGHQIKALVAETGK